MMMASFVALVEVMSPLYASHFSLSFSLLFYLFIFSFFLGSLKSTGGFIAVSRYASATMMPPSILSRGVGWQVVTWGTLKT